MAQSDAEHVEPEKDAPAEDLTPPNGVRLPKDEPPDRSAPTLPPPPPSEPPEEPVTPPPSYSGFGWLLGALAGFATAAGPDARLALLDPTEEP